MIFIVFYLFQNKAEKEQDRLERLSDKDDMTPSKNNRVHRSSKPNDVFSKMEDCDDKGNHQSPVKSSEIKSILNGLQGKSSFCLVCSLSTSK